MQHGQIGAGIASWWGQAVAGNYLAETDLRVPLLLYAAEDTSFQWSLLYEVGAVTKTPVQILMDLAYIRERYAEHPNFLRIGDRWVLFVYHSPGGGPASIDRWRRALEGYAKKYGADLLVVMQVFEGWSTSPYRNRFWWYQYAGAQPYEHHEPYAVCLSPGWWRPDQELPKLARDLDRWNANIRQMRTSGAALQLICSFNEWGEGTSIEAATEWADGSPYGSYIEALSRDGN